VVPSGGNADDIEIRVALGVGHDVESCGEGGPTCVVARRILRFGPHANVRVDVPLRQACVGVACPASQTCVRGGCVDATIGDPASCGRSGCDEEALGNASRPPPDAGLIDGAPRDGAPPPVDTGFCTDASTFCV